MSSGIEGLHRILKDQTREQVIILLSERSSLSYTELMEALNIVSTGTLNYHLKILGDLLTKNGSGQYMLSEKGQLAYRLLKMFPSENDVRLKKKRQKQFWVVAAVSQVIYFLSALTLFYLHYYDFGRLVEYTMWFFGGVILAFLGYRMQDRAPAPGSQQEKRNLRIAYPLAGGTLGLAAGFFGPVLATVISINLGGPNFLRTADALEAILFMVLSMVAGAVLGYFVGKRNNFCKPKWMTSMDERFGF